MLIDIHTHLVNPDFNPENCKKNFAINMFLKNVNFTNFDNYVKNLVEQIQQSKLDKAVLIPVENSELCADNEQVLKICAQHPEFLYAVNLNPYSDTIESDVKRAKENNAVLVKILPSFQNIDMSDKKCIPFFEILAENNLPLLVHTGKEYTLKTKNQKFNRPSLLENAARTGVKIICAHCGTRIFLHEKNYFNEWANLALKYENVYGDLSAMITPVQIWDLKKILKHTDLKNKVLFGTDYPGFPCEFSLKSSGNTFVDTYTFLENLGYNDKIFTNLEKVLNL